MLHLYHPLLCQKLPIKKYLDMALTHLYQIQGTIQKKNLLYSSTETTNVQKIKYYVDKKIMSSFLVFCLDLMNLNSFSQTKCYLCISAINQQSYLHLFDKTPEALMPWNLQMQFILLHWDWMFSSVKMTRCLKNGSWLRERSRENGGSCNISYFKLESFCTVIPATWNRVLSWSNIMA